MRPWHPWASPPGCPLVLEGEFPFVTAVAQTCTQPLHPHAAIHSVWGDPAELGPHHCAGAREV